MSRKPPSKATLKLGKNILLALEKSTPQALSFDGFQSFSHSQTWDDFPGSLRVTCYFSSDETLQAFYASGQEQAFIKLLQMNFLKVGIKFWQIKKNILFEVEHK
ncbi:MAG: hypothetical protein HRU20_13785 [Pseudomonadales bacterium]|nr:hypothetical protein [Pseudomonadales bacterium]